MRPRARALPLRERGASAVEYALLLAGVAAVLVAIVFALGQATEGMFKQTCEEIVAVQGEPAERCQQTP